jgi:hypothetical protein
MPDRRRGKGDDHEQGKKRLGQASVKDPNLILEQCYSQSPKDPLENDCT